MENADSDTVVRVPLAVAISAPVVALLLSVMFLFTVVYCLGRRSASRHAADATNAIHTSGKPLDAQLSIQFSKAGDMKTTAFDNQIYQELHSASLFAMGGNVAGSALPASWKGFTATRMFPSHRKIDPTLALDSPA